MDAVNRVLWLFIGLLLLAAGVLGILSNQAVFGNEARYVFLPHFLVRFWRQSLPWGLVVIGIVGLLIAWLGLRLLRAELRSSGRREMGDVTVDAPDDEGGRGSTRVNAPALAHATETHLERVRQVRRALVGLYGSPTAAELRIDLRVDADATQEVIRDAVQEASRALERTGHISIASKDVTLRLSDPRTGRVA